MKDLQTIFKVLKTSEINWIRHVFKYKNSSTRSNKKLQLFDLLYEQNNISDIEACQLIYKHKPNSAFSHLKKRLKDDILKYASLCPYKESSHLNEPDPDIKCQELLAKIKWILDRGLNNYASEFIEVTLNMVKKHELIPALIYLNEILITHKLKPVAGNVCEYLNEYIRIVFQHAHVKHGVNELQVQDINADEKPFNFKKNWYYNELHAVRQEIMQRNFNAALKKAILILDQINKHNALNLPNMKAETGILLAQIHVYLSNSYQAEKYARFALKFLDKRQSNFAREILFFAYFRSSNSSALMQLFKHKVYPEEKNNSCKWTLYKAYYLHLESKYKESLLTLQIEKSIWGNKSDTAIGYKLLEIMNLIELKEYDWFELRLDTFRKLLKHFSGSQYKRFHAAFHLLKKLSALNYNIRLLTVHESKIILALQEEKEGYYWNPMGPEIIRIETWITNKQTSARNIPDKKVILQKCN